VLISRLSSDSEKRVHQGWGGDDGGRELQNEQAAVADATGEATGGTDDWAGAGNTATADWADTANNEQQVDDWSSAPNAADTAPTGENKEVTNEPRRRGRQEEEEDDNTVTLDQYLAQKKQATSDLPKLEGIRKANEGSDENLWKNSVQNGKVNEEEDYFVGKVRMTNVNGALFLTDVSLLYRLNLLPNPRLRKRRKNSSRLKPDLRDPAEVGVDVDAVVMIAGDVEDVEATVTTTEAQAGHK
jgi:hypothetical protein